MLQQLKKCIANRPTTSHRSTRTVTARSQPANLPLSPSPRPRGDLQNIPERWDSHRFPRAMPWVTMLLEQGPLVQVGSGGVKLYPIQPENQYIEHGFHTVNWEKYLLISRPPNCALVAVSEQIGSAALLQFNRVSIYSCVGEKLHYLVY